MPDPFPLSPAPARPSPVRNCTRVAAITALFTLGLAVALPVPAAAQKKAGATKKPVAVKKPKAAKAPEARPKKETKPAAPVSAKPTGRKDASVAFFRVGVVPRLKIQIPDAELQRLRQKNREYVRCTVVEDDKTTYEHVGIHLKGAAGSFRGIDDKPALTLNFDKYKKDQEFHDLDKIHLNNSVQDASYLNELMSSELFLEAGIPAARTTHARVWLNGRDLGFYVLKEGFNKGFLKRHFADPTGNLYEGGFVQDIDGQVKLQNGEGPIDRSDVKAVIDACREGDAAKRWQRLEEVVDINRFITFTAMELLTCHWDGYCQNRNNYRFYFDPKTKKVQFFPHGMDQMFADPNYGVLNIPGSMVARAVMGNPEWRALYRDRLSELIKLFVPAERLHQRVDQHHQRLRPVLEEMGGNHASAFDGHVKALKDRLTARAKSLVQQNAVAETLPLRFSPSGVALVTRWAPRQEAGQTELPAAEEKAGKDTLSTLGITVKAAGRSVASWRTKVLLTAGKYRLEGRVRTDAVKGVAESIGTGVGLRISGSQRTNKLDGTSKWTTLSHEFRIQAPTQEVELVAELRATEGKAFFDASSLKLLKIRE